MIVASALLTGCDTILSEDMQDGLIHDGRAEIRNPFR
jgi:predicted nucleic acid-binding protein